MTEDKPHVIVVGGDEADSLLLNIWLDGFVSGAATALDNFTEDPDIERHRDLAVRLAQGLADDPAGRLTALDAIQARIFNPDGPGDFVTLTGEMNDD